MRYLMSNPQNKLRVVEGVVSMLAGDVFDNRAVRRRLLVFKAIYAVTWLFHWRDSLARKRIRRRAIRNSLRETPSQ
jgi:hypothetical protein